MVDIFVSFWQFTWQFMLCRKRQVLFYYPQHFNRSAGRTNPFFDLLLETCDRYGISYHLIEEPDWGTDKPRNDKAIKGDAFFVVVTAVRKAVSLFCHKDFWHNEQKVASIISILTLGRMKYRTYITISGSMLHLFGNLNKKGNVYDMQHGFLCKQHPVFFDEHQKLRPQYYQKNLHWLLWGKGYESSFIRGEEALFYGRTHVVGYPVPYFGLQSFHNDSIESSSVVLSLQLTPDWTYDILQKKIQLIDDALQEFAGLNVRVFLKHHPRYNNVISIDYLLEKYDFVELTSLSMTDLVPLTFLQITINSTTAFEYAEYGIPSFFIDPGGVSPNGALFYTEYQYPLYRHMTLRQVVERLQNAELYREDSRAVKKWYQSFYDDYNEQEFLKVLS